MRVAQRSNWRRMGQARLSRRALLRASLRAGVGAAGLALVGCGEDEDDAPTPAIAKPRRGGRARGAQIEEMIGNFGMDPHTSLEQSGLWRMIFDPLIATAPDGLIDQDASLAERHEFADDTTIVFSLREGVRFHDGTPFDGEAVRYNLARAVDPMLAGGGVYAAAFAAIEQIDVQHERTVQFKLASPNAALLTNLQERGGLMLSPHHAEASDAETLRTSPTGTGPYRLSRWIAQETTRLEAFEQYWRRRDDGGRYALLDEFALVPIADPAERAAAVLNGDLEFTIMPEDRAVDDLLESDDLQISTRSGYGHVSWYVNHALAPADNVDFRRALLYGWDKPGINARFFGGRAEPAASLLTPASWAYQPASTYPTAYDPAKAQEYMQRSGVAEADRVIEIAPVDEVMGRWLAVMAENWQALGVRTVIAPVGDATTRPWKNLGQPGDLQVLAIGGHRGEPDTTARLALTQSGAWNLGAAPTPELEPLVNEAIQTYDREQRRGIYARIQELHAEHLYSVLPGLYISVYSVNRPGVTGLSWDLNGIESYTDLARRAQ